MFECEGRAIAIARRSRRSGAARARFRSTSPKGVAGVFRSASLLLAAVVLSVYTTSDISASDLIWELFHR